MKGFKEIYTLYNKGVMNVMLNKMMLTNSNDYCKHCQKLECDMCGLNAELWPDYECIKTGTHCECKCECDGGPLKCCEEACGNDVTDIKRWKHLSLFNDDECQKCKDRFWSYWVIKERTPDDDYNGCMFSCVKLDDDYKENDYVTFVNSCKHPQKVEDEGTLFCLECGMVINDVIFFEDADHFKHQIIKVANDEQSELAKRSDPSEVITKPSDEELSDEEPSDVPEPENPKPENPKPKNPKPVKFPQSVGDLKKMAKEKGIKYYSRMSEEELCTVLETRIVKPSKIVFINKETGEELGFKSLYKAAQDMKVNPGLISYYIDNKKEMKIGHTTYTIRKNKKI